VEHSKFLNCRPLSASLSQNPLVLARRAARASELSKLYAWNGAGGRLGHDPAGMLSGINPTRQSLFS
jgi:hypothetical protein